ncbi:MAG TPA: hypothetical protein VNA20_10660 [Frankiaceae bacterium]|nr:hypothetical protein [Frankiaceae bacterium]
MTTSVPHAAAPSFDPRPGDYPEMLAIAGRMRRTRRRLGATAIVPVVAIAATVAFPRDDASIRLRPAASPPAATAAEPAGDDDETPERSGVPAPTTGPQAPGAALPTGVVLPSPLESLVPTLPPLTPSPTTPPPSPTPTATGTHTPEPRYPATYRYAAGTAPAECPTISATPIYTCGQYTGARTFVAGVGGDLGFQLCVEDLALAPVIVTVDEAGRWLTAKAMRGPGPEPWTWDEVSPPTDDRITISPGDCAEWTVKWQARDNAGAPLPPDNYIVMWDFRVDGMDSGNGGWMTNVDVTA